jgi:hypothetical protein
MGTVRATRCCTDQHLSGLFGPFTEDGNMLGYLPMGQSTRRVLK